MKTINFFIGLFLIGLLAQYGLADAKRTQRQAYLPPAAQKVYREEIITIHEGPSGQTHFDESNYGGGKYQIFEVHNHFEPSGQNVATQSHFNAPGYLPPEQQIRVQHVHQAQGANVNNLDISSSSYSNAVSSGGQHVRPSAGAPSHSIPSNHQHAGQSAGRNSGQAEEVLRVQHIHVNRVNTANVQQSGFRAPDYLPPNSGNEAVSIPQSSFGINGASNLPSIEQHSTGLQQPYNSPQYTAPLSQSHQHQESHETVGQGSFKGTDYLPPQQGQQHAHHNEIQHQAQQQNQFRAPDYLPPYQAQQHSQNIDIPHHVEHHNEIQHQAQQPNQFRAPDYLPPYQAQQHSQNIDIPHHVEQQSNQLKGPDYLPPHQVHQDTHHNEIQQPGQFNGPDYLPPDQTSSQYNPQQVQQSEQFKAPDYLPPQQSFDQHQLQQTAQFKGPDYLPPQNGQQPNYQQSHVAQPAQFQGSSYSQQSLSQSHAVHQAPQPTAFNGPDYLPPHQTAHLESAHQQAGQTAEFRAPDYLPPQQASHLHGSSQGIVSQQPNFLSQQPQQPQVLPPGYDFEKPENAEAAIAELHTLPQEDQQEFVGPNQQQGQIISGQQQSHHIQGNAANYNDQQGNVQAVTSNLRQVSPQLFSPKPAAAPVQSPVQNYLPPARPVQAEQYSNLHSLSSYMSNIQPDVRYGVAQFSAPRRPFPEYGPPPANVALNGNFGGQQGQQQQSVALPVAPMYHDQATISPNYAPAMSYASSAAYQQSGNQYQQQHATFNQQTKPNLQRFMPQAVQQSSPNSIQAAVSRPVLAAPAPAVPVHQTTSSRVRTVQISNPSAVKTLNILETSDQAGVKTIKILGPSQSQPTGEHHIVKVVTQNGSSPDEHIQTVKIYNNDHVDASNSGRNAYLPPAARVVRQTLTKQKQRQPFTGRQH